MFSLFIYLPKCVHNLYSELHTLNIHQNTHTYIHITHGWEHYGTPKLTIFCLHHPLAILEHFPLRTHVENATNSGLGWG